mgnify:CR=1 FL=1
MQSMGELLDLDGKLNRLGQKLEQQFGGQADLNEGGRTRKSLAEGFVSASMLFCVAALCRRLHCPAERAPFVCRRRSR